MSASSQRLYLHQIQRWVSTMSDVYSVWRCLGLCASWNRWGWLNRYHSEPVMTVTSVHCCCCCCWCWLDLVTSSHLIASTHLIIIIQHKSEENVCQVEQSIVTSVPVCLSVSLSAGLSQEPHVRISPISLFVLLAVLLCRRCNMTSSFVDNLIFSYNKPYASVTLPQQLRCNVVHGLTSLMRGCPVLVNGGCQERRVLSVEGQRGRSLRCTIALLYDGSTSHPSDIRH